jgi:Uncharacterized conserved protein
MSIRSNGFEDQVQVIDKIEKRDMTIEVIEFNQLKGSQSPGTAMEMMFAQQAGMRLRQIRINLRGGSIKTESGALYFSKGNISCDTQIGGIGGALGKMFKSTLNSESTFKPVYSGDGEIYLEPTFNNFIMLEIDNDSVIVDKGYFYCCSANMKVEPIMQGNISSAVMGGEGLFQAKIEGTGIVVLEIPVPQQEILKYELTGDRLQVDGNFAILRTGNVKFSVQKSSKSLIGSLMNGEGLLQTFEGNGQVWLAPTACVYNRLALGSFGLVNASNKSMNNKQ